MSKDKGKITRKRFCKLVAANTGNQVQAMRDAVRKVLVEPGQRAQEKRQTEAHRREKKA